MLTSKFSGFDGSVSKLHLHGNLSSGLSSGHGRHASIVENEHNTSNTNVNIL